MSIDPDLIARLITEDPDIFISESEYNKSGVPYYANPDTPAVKPGALHRKPAEYREKSVAFLGTKAMRDLVKNRMGVQRTGEMEGMRVDCEGYGPSTIIRAGEKSITIKPDNSHRKFAMNYYKFEEIAYPMGGPEGDEYEEDYDEEDYDQEEYNNPIIRNYSFDELE